MNAHLCRRFFAFLFSTLIPLGGAAKAATVTAHFDSPSTVPLTSESYTATGNTVDIQLSFTPPTGTDLTVVRVSGLEFIVGKFDNLAQGQIVPLSFGGATYQFVANYFGGSGNDLVLHWAATRALAWGSNFDGQLGNGSSADSDIPAAVDRTGVLAGKTIIAIGCGGLHSLALTADGTLAAWGANNFGQLGDGTTQSSSVPVRVNQTGVLTGKTVIAVTAGSSHSLVLCSDGTLAAWGSNDSGRLGNGTTSASPVPVLVDQTGALAGKTVIAVTAGGSHCLALCSDGVVIAWGSNSNGQLGNGSTVQSSVPVSLAASGLLAGQPAMAIAAGNNHSLALCGDGRIASWGSNSLGQLGASSTIPQSTVPVAVDQTGVLAGKSIVGIAAGGYHSLALGTDGKLAAWGYNYYGQLGNDGSAYSTVSIPVAVNTAGVLKGLAVATITSGGSNSLALTKNGTLVSWGANDFGQLGDGTTTLSNLPVAVNQSMLAPGEKFVRVASGQGGSHSLAVVAMPFTPQLVVETSAGAVLTNGQANVDLGATAVGATISQTFTIKNAGVVPLSVGAVTIDGQNAAEFGVVTQPATHVVAGGSTTFEVAFSPSAEFNRVAALHLTSSDPNHGSFNLGLIGIGRGVLTATYHTGAEVPMSVSKLTATGSRVDLALNHAPRTGAKLMVVRITSLGFINGTFDNLANGQVVPLTYGGMTYSFVANYFGGSGNDLVLEWAAARLLSWGYNQSGQLGIGTTVTSTSPVAVPPTEVLAGKRIVAMASGNSHSLAWCADGSMAAWGSNSYGQLGNGSTSESYLPVAVVQTGVLAGKSVIAGAVGEYHNLALCSDGTLTVWGYNGNGQLGNGTFNSSNTPVAVSTTGALNGKKIVAVAAGEDHSLVLCADGTLAAWGYNSYGQLGNGSNTPSNVPVTISSLGVLAGKTVASIAAGSSHNLALCTDGTLVAWGYNNYGQLGTGATSNSNVPVAVNTAGVLAGKTIVAIAAGDLHSLALCADGTLTAWGFNSSGQLGNGNTSTSSLPVRVDRSGALAGKGIVSITAGASHSLVLCADGAMVSWGYNYRGQLGTGDTSSSSVPVAVSANALASGEVTIAAKTHEGASHNFSLVAVPMVPRLVVEQPSGTVLVSGRSAVDFGVNSVGTEASRTFTIRNPGIAPLDISSLTLVGSHAADFKLTTLPAASVAAGGSTTFAVTFTAGTKFTRQASIRLASNDLEAGVFELRLTAAVPGSLVADFGSSADIPLTTDGFTATGSTVELALNHAPATGASLMVVRNSGLGPINGIFGNLTQGQVLTFSYGGSIYKFVANYHGGNGNDLVLQWAASRLMAWGENDSGQLGDNRLINSSLPTEVSVAGVLAGKTIIATAAGVSHSLALSANGTVAAWGSNTYGQLGNQSSTASSVPVAVNTSGVLAGKTVAAIAAGDFHNLALCTDGTLAAWGNNGSGQLGNGNSNSTNTPVAVNQSGALAGRTVVAVAAGSYHSLALCADGMLAAWGTNSSGQLGNGSTTNSPVPVAVVQSEMAPGARFTLVASDQSPNHNLGIVASPAAARLALEQPAGANLANGSGSVNFGFSPLGSAITRTFTIRNIGTLNLTNVAIAFDGANGGDFAVTSPPIATVVPGGSTSFAVAFTPRGIDVRNCVMRITSNDPLPGGYSVNLSGSSSGALEATYHTGSEVPLAATSFVATGNTVNLTLNHAPSPGTTLVVVKNTGVNFIQGEFDNLTQGQVVPLTFGGITYSFVANYFGGTGNDLVLHWAASRLLAWGANGSGRLGNGSIAQSNTPTEVTRDGCLAGKTVIATAAGSGHSVALCSDGTLAAWGDNSFGQLGNRSTTSSLVPVPVIQTEALAGKTVIAIAAGRFHNLALCTDGTLAAWGRGIEGQLGINNQANNLVPVAVNTATGSALAGKLVVAIAAGAYHSLALIADGSLVAWGYNQSGQLGVNTTINRSLPTAVNTVVGSSVLFGKKVTAIAAGESHTVALCSDRTIAVWGNNSYGQIGGFSSSSSTVPKALTTAGTVLTDKTPIAVAAGANHTLVLCDDGSLVAWGDNSSGQLGDNTTNSSFINPIVAVNTTGGLSALAGRTVVAIACGYRHSIALCADGTLTAWGYNYYGQLGDSTVTLRKVPVEVSTATLPTGAGWLAGASGQSAYHSLAIAADPITPAIAVEFPLAVALIDDVSAVDFGAIASGSGSIRVFTIRNPGNAPLTGLFIATDGPHAHDFEVTQPGTTTIAPGDSSTFTVTFLPTGLAARTARLHIISNVTGDVNPFDVELTGTGLSHLEQWRLAHFQTTENSGLAANTATPQNDGISNLMKFATGMDPTRSGVQPGQLAHAGDHAVFSYPRSKAAVSDGFSFTVEWSDTLAADSWSHLGVSESITDQGELDLVTATLPAGRQKFIRLRLTGATTR